MLSREQIGERRATGCAARLAAVSNIVIRLAEPHDVPDLAALRWQFKMEDADGNLGKENEAEFTARCEEWIETQIQMGSWCFRLAEVDGRPCGHSWVSWTRCPTQSQGRRCSGT